MDDTKIIITAVMLSMDNSKHKAINHRIPPNKMKMPLIFLEFSFINGTECSINNSDVPISDKIEPKKNINEDIF